MPHSILSPDEDLRILGALSPVHPLEADDGPAAIKPLPGVGDLPRRIGAAQAAKPTKTEEEDTSKTYTGAFPCAF